MLIIKPISGVKHSSGLVLFCTNKVYIAYIRLLYQIFFLIFLHSRGFYFTLYNKEIECLHNRIFYLYCLCIGYVGNLMTNDLILNNNSSYYTVVI